MPPLPQIMLNQVDIIRAFVNVSNSLSESNEVLSAQVNKTYVNNNWLTKENYWQAINYWKQALTTENLTNFSGKYSFSTEPKDVGIIMAGNIPLVGFHDVLCVLLSGNNALVKPSSDDKYVIGLVIKMLGEENEELGKRIKLVEKLTDIDAVIATGSNNTFRYFEYYFKSIPSLLRKNRKSIAVLTGDENEEDLSKLADDVFQYFGLGCRNVSYILLPKSMNISLILDQFMKYIDLANHNKFANNYTYHKALLLMNNEQHLDAGFALAKEREELNAPLACLHYRYYNNLSEIDAFIAKETENIQCVVGNYSDLAKVAFGEAQNPDLQDFADNVDTMQFLNNLK